MFSMSLGIISLATPLPLNREGDETNQGYTGTRIGNEVM